MLCTFFFFYRTFANGGCVTLRNKHTLPDLPYDYNALEPVISAEIMQLHHQKHHQTYLNVLNETEMKLAEAKDKGLSISLFSSK